LLELQTQTLGPEKARADSYIPQVIKWNKVNMIRDHSFLATVQEIIDFSSEIDVTKVGIIGDPHSGKTTMGDCIAHCIHKYAKVPYAIRRFKKEDLLNFKDTLKTLSPVNHVLLFGDLSFLGAEASKKQIEMVKMASTQIRHIEGGRDVKIISIYDYHYSLGLDKYLRQADYKYLTTVGSSELGNLETMFGSKYMRLIRDFQKYRLKAVTKKYWTVRSKNNKKEVVAYHYRNPFIPALFFSDSLRLIVSPKREWIDPICSKCSEAFGQIEQSNIPIEDLAQQGEINFGKSNFLGAVQLELYVNGLTTLGNHKLQALRWIQRARMQNKITLEQLALHYNLSATNTKLRKKPYEAQIQKKTQIEPETIEIASEPEFNPYSEYDTWNYDSLVKEIEGMTKLPQEKIDIPKYEYLNAKAREIGFAK